MGQVEQVDGVDMVVVGGHDIRCEKEFIFYMNLLGRII
jgi:hypothetical protein